jgi:hypothetical protein
MLQLLCVRCTKKCTTTQCSDCIFHISPPGALDFQTAIYYFSQNQIIFLTHAANSGYILKLNTQRTDSCNSY